MVHIKKILKKNNVTIFISIFQNWLDITFLKIFLFDVDYFLSLYWICYNIPSVLCFGFFGHKACGILAPRPGIEPTCPALEGEVLTTGPPGKSLPLFFKTPMKQIWSTGIKLSPQ